MMAIISQGLLQPERISVHSEGDLVVIQLGNVTFKLPYEGAFTLSQWIRLKAKESKRRVGDTSRHWSVIGTLEHASSR